MTTTTNYVVDDDLDDGDNGTAAKKKRRRYQIEIVVDLKRLHAVLAWALSSSAATNTKLSQHITLQFIRPCVEQTCYLFDLNALFPE